MSLEDGLHLIAERGRLMQSVEPGDMLSVPLSDKDLEPYMNERLSLAAVNAPSLCVASGPSDAVAELKEALEADGIPTTLLHTSHAFHSSMMDGILEEFTALVASIPMRAPQIEYVSNLTGTWITDEQATSPDYWADHLRGCVRFSEGVATLLEDPHTVLLEVGPGRTLATLTQKQLRGMDSKDSSLTVTSMRQPKDQTGDTEMLLRALGHLDAAGLTIDWETFYASETRGRVPLPTYPFERQRFWVQKYKSDSVSMEFGKKADIADWFTIPSWRQSILPVALAEAEPVSNSEESPEDDASTAAPLTVVFMDEFGVAAGLADKNPEAVLVFAGDGFQKLDAQRYHIDPEDEEDYATLFSEFYDDIRPLRVAYCWGLKTGPSAMEAHGDLEQAKKRGFFGPLFLAKAIGRLGGKSRIDVALVTNNAHEVSGQDLSYPES
ncbi:MAG: acyltransferase domain-containing protein, partial [Acidobacteriota bacterium]